MALWIVRSLHIFPLFFLKMSLHTIDYFRGFEESSELDVTPFFYFCLYWWYFGALFNKHIVSKFFFLFLYFPSSILSCLDTEICFIIFVCLCRSNFPTSDQNDFRWIVLILCRKVS